MQDAAPTRPTSSPTDRAAWDTPPKSLRLMAAVARWVWGLVIAIGLLLGATWLALHEWIVPRIEDFRPRLESLASQAVGIPVRVGSISGWSSGLVSTFELKDVTLQDAAGRQVLLLPRVLVALSATSLWSGGFEQLVIDRPVLDIRRTLEGKIYVGGLDVDQKRSGGTGAADWFFSQPEFSIQGGAVRWTDELAKAPVLELKQVDVLVKNSARRHSFRLDATPPPNWGERFSLRGLFRQPLLSHGAGDFSDWSGQLYAEFPQVGNVAQIKPYLTSTFGVDPKAGSGSLRAWADVSKGRMGGATLDVALQGVDVQLGKSLSPLVLSTVTGRVGGRLLPDGFEFATEGLTFNTQDGLVWPGGNLSMTSQGIAGMTAQKNELKADRLDLAAVAQIASRLPLGTQTHALIASFEPKGLVQTLQASWLLPANSDVAGDASAITYSAKGLVTGLEIAALPSPLVRSTPSVASASKLGGAPMASGQFPSHQQPGRPGISGATVDFDLTQAGGKAAINISRGHLDLPGVFEDPRVVFDKLSLDAQWKLAGEKLDTHFRNIKFSAADAEGQAEAHWRSPDGKASGVEGSLGVLDLKGVISRGNGARVHRYLPLVLADPVRHYVRDAVVQGEVADVKFLVKGPVDLIPFPDASKGDFKISAKVKNGLFAYVPKVIQPAGAAPWPQLSDINAELVFNRASLDVNNVVAKIAGLPGLQVVKADARIPNLMRGATVEVQARLKGPVGDALGFVNASPLSGMTGHVLTGAVVSGSADYALRLSLPINNIEKTAVQGTVTLPGNEAQFSSATPLLSRLKGVATFSESGFNVPAAQARLLGGDVRFEGGMRSGTDTAAASPEPGANFALGASPVFRAQGTLTSEALRQAGGIASRVAQNATGTAAYSAVIGFRRGVAEVMVTSNLQGMALSLPAPLNKPADTLMPVRFENALVRDLAGPGQPLQDQLSLSIASLASVQYVRDISGPQAKVIRGSLAIGLDAGESSVLPDSGVAANIKLTSLNLDAWEKVFASTTGLPTSTVASATASTAALLAQSYLPNQLALRAKELVVGGRRLNNLVIGGTRDGSLWRANLDAAELNGYLEFRQPGTANSGRVYARLSRLSLGPSNASDVESLLDEQPANIPALDIVVDELELRGKKLGRIEIDAINQAGQAAGNVREWRLRKFDVTLPEAVFKATGNWVALQTQTTQGLGRAQRSPDRRRTVMNFDLTLLDSGELLKRLGLNDVVRRGKGKMSGQIAWLGSPLTLDYPSMSGQFNINIEAGQFLKADPGLAKLLGVLSLQSLPRRLALDFRDVFSEGFAFDFVRGDVSITQGLATTNNLQMKGVNAAVLMEGSADIAKETQDLKVIVVPEINAGTASLITAVINPVVGLGTFLAQVFLRQPLIKAATQEFHIDGSWADPKVTKVSRGDAAKPAADSKPFDKASEKQNDKQNDKPNE